MATSKATLQDIINVMVRYVPASRAASLAADLMRIDGNAAAKAAIHSLVTGLQETAETYRKQGNLR